MAISTPASRGLIWWNEGRPADLPDPASIFSRVATEFGCEPVARVVDVLGGGLVLVVGTPDGPASTYGQRDQCRPNLMARQRHPARGGDGTATRPSLAGSIPAIRTKAYCRGSRTPWSSFARRSRDWPIAGCMSSSTGYQSLPEPVRRLPENFMLAPYLPGLAMAEHSDLMIHHRGHGSVMTGLQPGTP
jgi:hypothetical protein